MEQFWSKVAKGAVNECWLWQAGTQGNGYGQFTLKQRKWQAHRFAWVQANSRDIPPGGMICHACDQPLCCNPAHLFLSSSTDNMRDMAMKRRSRGQAQTHCANGHEYTPENTYWRPGKVAGRDCRACIRARTAAYRRRARSTGEGQTA